MGVGGQVRATRVQLEALMRAEAALARHTQRIVMVREGWNPSDWDQRHARINLMLDDWQTRPP
jgi:predicted amidohydrolase YtcJ